MNRKAFVGELQEALEHKMSKSEIDSQVKYYTDYIKEQVRLGRSEQDVIQELGDPWVLAKNLSGASSDSYVEDERDYGNVNVGGTTQGHKVYATNNKWVGYGILLVVIMVLFFIFRLATNLFIWLSPILIPLIFINWILRRLRR